MPGATNALKQMDGPGLGVSAAFTFLITVDVLNLDGNGVGFLNTGSGEYVVARAVSVDANLTGDFFSILYPALGPNATIVVAASYSAARADANIWDGSAWNYSSTASSGGTLDLGATLSFVSDLFGAASFTDFFDTVGFWQSQLDLTDAATLATLLANPLSLAPQAYFGGCNNFPLDQATGTVFSVTRGSYIKTSDCAVAVNAGPFYPPFGALGSNNLNPGNISLNVRRTTLNMPMLTCERKIRLGM